MRKFRHLCEHQSSQVFRFNLTAVENFRKGRTTIVVLVCSLASLGLITLNVAVKRPPICVYKVQQTMEETDIVLPCPWQPCSSTDSVHDPNSIYPKLGELYKEATLRKIPPPVLVSGQARHFYIHGSIDQRDSDIDLHSPLEETCWSQLVLNLSSVKPKVSVHISTGNAEYGTCECRLPGMYPFLCITNIESYLYSVYGSSWWIDIPHMKSSIVIGNESQPGWVRPALNSLKNYDKNEDGHISVNEIGNQTCEVSANLNEQAAADLTLLLIKLEALSVTYEDY